ncbi:hypothetical protein R80B4_01882 [Fibrobacteres bacterium R8-0-B4]
MYHDTAENKPKTDANGLISAVSAHAAGKADRITVQFKRSFF